MRDRGIVMLCTSLTQTLTMDDENAVVATGKRNKMAHFRVHKVAEGNVRMFESVVYPGNFLRMQEGSCDVNVRNLSFVLSSSNCFNGPAPQISDGRGIRML